MRKNRKKDYTNLYTSCLTIFSGNWNNASNAGTFQLNLNNTFDLSNANVTCHLLFSQNRFIKTAVIPLPCHLAKYKNIQTVLVICKGENSGKKTSREYG